MLHTKYQGSRPCGFRQMIFSGFSYISLCETCEPKAGHFGPQGHTLNTLGRGLLIMLHTKYQGSMPCGFRQDDFFHVSLYKPM